MGFFDKIRNGLSKTKDKLSESLDNVVKGFRRVDDELLDELEESLILADLGAQTAADVVERLRDEVKSGRLKDPEEVRGALRTILVSMLETEGAQARGPYGLKLGTKPSVILVIGVNGVGKTTSIGKLAGYLHAQGKHVVLAAADTFRAAAADQLAIWAARAGADIVRQDEGSDPAAVVYDAIAAARARGADVVICDTAGRLHNKLNLMKELEKIGRVIDRELPDADRETLLVLDATTGQNALSQAKTFKETAGITGIILTKLDGTAKGGIVLPIVHSLGVPVKLVCVGEGMDDMLPFDAQDFVKALF